MNFDFPDELKQLRDEARRFLSAECPLTLVRETMDNPDQARSRLWRQVAELGWLGVTIDEEYGGLGLGEEALCVIAEELGRALAPIPYASSVYLATAAINDHAAPEQKAEWLPPMAEGSRTGCVALMEGSGQPGESALNARYQGGRISGTKWPVPDGADFAIVAALHENNVPGLFYVNLAGAGVTCTRLDSIDPTLGLVRIDLQDAPAQMLGTEACGWSKIEELLDRAAVPLAFEQVGGAQASLEMARQYALDRYAFGRPIGSFQAIKHKLADAFVTIELARSNAYYGAWAIASRSDETPTAAATAMLSAASAFQQVARENVHVHGGLGCTWEFDCQFYYRRSKMLAVMLGGSPYWRDRLITRLTAPLIS